MTNLEWLFAATTVGSLVLVAVAGSRWTHWKGEAAESWRTAERYWRERNAFRDQLERQNGASAAPIPVDDIARQILNTDRFYASNPQLSPEHSTYERRYDVFPNSIARHPEQYDIVDDGKVVQFRPKRREPSRL